MHWSWTLRRMVLLCWTTLTLMLLAAESAQVKRKQGVFSRMLTHCVGCIGMDRGCLELLQDYDIKLTMDRREWCYELERSEHLTSVFGSFVERSFQRRDDAFDTADVDLWLPLLATLAEHDLSAKCAAELLENNYVFNENVFGLCGRMTEWMQFELLVTSLKIFSPYHRPPSLRHKLIPSLRASELQVIMEFRGHRSGFQAIRLALENAVQFEKRPEGFENVLHLVSAAQNSLTLICLAGINQQGKTMLNLGLADVCVDHIQHDHQIQWMRAYTDILRVYSQRPKIVAQELWEFVQLPKYPGNELRNMLAAVYANRKGTRSREFHQILHVLRGSRSATTWFCIQTLNINVHPFNDVRYAWLCRESPEFVLEQDRRLKLPQGSWYLSFDKVMETVSSAAVLCLQVFRKEEWVLAACVLAKDGNALGAMVAVWENRNRHQMKTEYVHMKTASAAADSTHLGCLRGVRRPLSLSLIRQCVHGDEQGTDVIVISPRSSESSTSVTSDTSLVSLDENEEIECPICMDNIDQGNLLEWNDCCHEFHRDCIKCLREKSARPGAIECPLCRRPERM